MWHNSDCLARLLSSPILPLGQLQTGPALGRTCGPRPPLWGEQGRGPACEKGPGSWGAHWAPRGLAGRSSLASHTLTFVAGEHWTPCLWPPWEPRARGAGASAIGLPHQGCRWDPTGPEEEDGSEAHRTQPGRPAGQTGPGQRPVRACGGWTPRPRLQSRRAPQLRMAKPESRGCRSGG